MSTTGIVLCVIGIVAFLSGVLTGMTNNEFGGFEKIEIGVGLLLIYLGCYIS